MLDGSTLTSDPEMAEAYYYFAYYGLKLKKLSQEEIKKYIKKGKAITRDSKYIGMYAVLEEMLKEKIGTDSSDLKMGSIDWYNKNKYYGIIRSEDETYLFFLNGFDKRLDQDEINRLEGRNVAFSIDANPDPEKKKSNIAVNIHLEVD